MIYRGTSDKRQKHFSFYNVMMIGELRSLIWLGFLKNTAVEIGVILEIVGVSPP